MIAVAGPLLFATGCLLFALSLGHEVNYLRDYLPATILTGTGVGTTFAGFSSAAVAGLQPARFATGSAILACFRQVGAVLGVSVLIAVLDGATPASALHTFHRAYALMALASAAAALVALGLGRVRARSAGRGRSRACQKRLLADLPGGRSDWSDR